MDKLEEEQPTEPVPDRTPAQDGVQVADYVIGCTLDEFLAWIESWDTPNELPEPTYRRIG